MSELTEQEQFNLGFIVMDLFQTSNYERTFELFFERYTDEGIITGRGLNNHEKRYTDHGGGEYFVAFDKSNREEQGDEPRLSGSAFVPSKLSHGDVYVSEGVEYVVIASEIDHHSLPIRENNDGFGDYGHIFLAIERERLGKLVFFSGETGVYTGKEEPAPAPTPVALRT